MNNKNPIGIMKIKDFGEIKFELYPEIAPITVSNFIDLIKKGFYNGLTFHRIIKNFVIQGGCPEGSGMGGPGYSIKGEFKLNNVENNIKHELGVLSMARANHPDSAGSQFFIMVGNAPHLDGSYAGFGKVIDGIDVILNTADEPVFGDTPNNKPVIEKIEIDTFGIEYVLTDDNKIN